MSKANYKILIVFYPLKKSLVHTFWNYLMLCSFESINLVSHITHTHYLNINLLSGCSACKLTINHYAVPKLVHDAYFVSAFCYSGLFAIRTSNLSNHTSRMNESNLRFDQPTVTLSQIIGNKKL